MSHRTVRLASLLACVAPFPAIAQIPPPPAVAPIDADEIIVTGTRAAQRTLFESLAPVDVIDERSLEATVSDDLNDKLAQLVPSFNVQRLPAADGLAFIRPARLRGLSPDQTLVLVNGKRFHRSAHVGARGAQGVDLAQIGSFAIGRIEVLRDGASAQYGSDAIAGVINLVLDTDPGFRAFGQYSEYYEGDGAQVRLGGQAGVAIGDGGYIVATAEYTDANATSRTRQRPDAIAFQAANPGLAVPNPVQRWGQPDLQTVRLGLNAALPIGAAELYAFGTYGAGEGVTDFNWRNPDGTPNTYNPSSVFPGFNLRSIFPTGFTPRFGQEDEDYQLVGGVRGSLGDALRWDASASYGQNEVDYFIRETINASLGPQSPTEFRPGILRQKEFNLNLDLVYELPIAGLADPVNFAFGGERRVEIYEIEAGDVASYTVGPGARTGLASGSNGFPGYAPDQAGRFDQESYAAYLDVEAPLLPGWVVGGAVRYEDFSEFGNTTDFKVASRLEITPAVALRTSYSTGFRAPTPAQLNSTRTSQGLDTRTLQVVTSGRLSPTNPVSVFFGAAPLRPETSKAISAGATWRTDIGFSGSIDAYQIDVADRFSGSRNFVVTSAVRAQLIAQGIAGGESVTNVNFFTNDFDTRTRGVDVVAAYASALGSGRLNLSAVYNYNDTKVQRGAIVTNPTATRLFEEGLPKHNAVATAIYSVGLIELLARGRYYGKWTDSSGNVTGDVFQTFGGIALFDASISYRWRERFVLRVGAENLFDTYPDEATLQANRGLIYSRNAPYDTDGGQYYVRLEARF